MMLRWVGGHTSLVAQLETTGRRGRGMDQCGARALNLDEKKNNTLNQGQKMVLNEQGVAGSGAIGQIFDSCVFFVHLFP